MSMQATKRESHWISSPIKQEAADTGWVEHQAIFDGTLGPVQKLTGTDSTQLVAWDYELSNGEKFVVRQDGTVYESTANVTSSQNVEVSRDYGLDSISYIAGGPVLVAVSGRGVFTFSGDGSKFYSISNDFVVQFSLTTPWDLKGGGQYVFEYLDTSDYNISYISIDTMLFSGDGTKFYIGENDNIHQFTLSVAWDITSVTSHSVASQQNANCIFFSSDGTKMYTHFDKTLSQSTLSTPWDVTTATSDGLQSEYTTTVDSGYIAGGSNIKSDGTKIILVTESEYIVSIDLTTPNDLSTATNEQAIDFSTDLTLNFVHAYVKADGLTIFTVDHGDDYSQISLGVAWDVTSASFDYKDYPLEFVWDRLFFGGIHSDGMIYYVGRGRVVQLSFPAPYDVENAAYVTTFDFSNDPDRSPQATDDIGFTATPNKFVCIDQNGDFISYDMTTNWNVSTAVKDTAVPYSLPYLPTGNPHFSQDGTRLFIPEGRKVHSYTLSSAFSVDSAHVTFDQTVTLSDMTEITHITTSADGTKLYVGFDGVAVYGIHEYQMTTPWDISTATLNTSDQNLYIYSVDLSDNLAFGVSQSRLSKLNLPSDTIYTEQENTIDLSAFSLSVPPQYVFSQLPEMRVCVEDTAVRCVSRDTPMTLISTAAGSIQVTYSDQLGSILAAGDYVVVDEGDVQITGIVDTGTTSGTDKIWEITLPLTVTPTFAHIKDRSVLSTYPRTPINVSVDSVNTSVATTGAISHTFPSVDYVSDPKRAIQLSVIGGNNTITTSLTANLWKSGTT